MGADGVFSNPTSYLVTLRVSKRNLVVAAEVITRLVVVLVGLLLASNELELATDDLGAIAGLTVLLVRRGTKLTLDENLLALGEVIRKAFSLLVEERHAMPFGQLLQLAALVLEGLVRRKPQLENGHTARCDLQFGVRPEIAHQNDLVHFFTAMYFS